MLELFLLARRYAFKVYFTSIYTSRYTIIHRKSIFKSQQSFISNEKRIVHSQDYEKRGVQLGTGLTQKQGTQNPLRISPPC